MCVISFIKRVEPKCFRSLDSDEMETDCKQNVIWQVLLIHYW